MSKWPPFPPPDFDPNLATIQIVTAEVECPDCLGFGSAFPLLHKGANCSRCGNTGRVVGRKAALAFARSRQKGEGNVPSTTQGPPR